MKATEKEIKEIMKWVAFEFKTDGISDEDLDQLFDDFMNNKPFTWEITTN